MLVIAGGGYAKLKERQGSKELLDPDTISSANKMSPDDVDEGLMSETKESSATPGRQSVGLLAGTARLVKRAVATTDRYKQFIDADIDTEAAPIALSDCDGDGGHSVESGGADELHTSQQQLDDTGLHAAKLSAAPQQSLAVTTLTATSSIHQPVIQIRRVTLDSGHDRRAVRQRPARPYFSAHPVSSVNPFSLGKTMPSLSCSASASAVASSATSCSDRVDVFGAAPFRRKVFGPVESKAESADSVGELDVFANVPFVRQQEKSAKPASSVSPPVTLSKAVTVPNPAAIGSDAGTYSAFSPAVTYSAGTVYTPTSAVFHQSSSGPTSAFVKPTQYDGAQMHIVGTSSSGIQPYSVDTQEMSAYAQDSGPLLVSPPLSVAGKGSHTIWFGTVSDECLDPLSYKASFHLPVLPSDASQSMFEEPQATDEPHSTGSLKKGWLAKLRSEKESPTTAVANLGFSDDPDAMLAQLALPTGDLSFHEDMLDALAEPKSPAIVDESNFLLPSTEGSHTLPKVGVKKHSSHAHRVPPLPPETDSFSVTKKGIALL